jgi:hypothetical protein
MRSAATAIVGLLVATTVYAQAAPTREVANGTLISKADPAASFRFDKAFQYAGGQTIDIMKVAGAEQYFFVDAGPDHAIRRFYWVQFEHYYPTNDHRYDYSEITQKPVRIGRLDFMGDVRTSPNYFTMDDRPGSDSKAGETLLRSKGFNISGTFVTLRLFHLPDDTRRREVMIIYGEVLPPGAAQQAVESAITAHAQANLQIP